MHAPHFSLAAMLKPLVVADRGFPHHGPSPHQIAAALEALRLSGRRSIRILDLDCGTGQRLLRIAALAREMGFVAIEGRGVDLSAPRVRVARWEAEAQAHPSTTLAFDLLEPIVALAEEHDEAADLVLLSDSLPPPASALAIAINRVCTGAVLASR